MSSSDNRAQRAALRGSSWSVGTAFLIDTERGATDLEDLIGDDGDDDEDVASQASRHPGL